MSGTFDLPVVRDHVQPIKCETDVLAREISDSAHGMRPTVFESTDQVATCIDFEVSGAFDVSAVFAKSIHVDKGGHGILCQHVNTSM